MTSLDFQDNIWKQFQYQVVATCKKCGKQFENFSNHDAHHHVNNGQCSNSNSNHQEKQDQQQTCPFKAQNENSSSTSSTDGTTNKNTCPFTGKTSTFNSIGESNASSKATRSFSDAPPLQKAGSLPQRIMGGKKVEPCYYHDYLQLDKILDAQELVSDKHGKHARDEHLFIVVHQTYELWFKQILFELEGVHKIFQQTTIPMKDIGKASAYLHRTSEIFRVLHSQLTVLETMTPLGFLEFRDFLFPASGFQSVQFRLLEINLGLRNNQRISYGKRGYCTYLADEHSTLCKDAEKKDSILDLLGRWLERTPFLELGDFSFWKVYAEAIKKMHDNDRAFIRDCQEISPEDKQSQLEELETKYEHYRIIYDENAYNECYEKGSIQLSQKALQAALLIMLYQEEPILQKPHTLLLQLFDIDQHLTQWRYRHALMVHRMLGTKIGTGGSSGFHYLRATATQHRIFKDLFQLPTFLIPRNDLPVLPPHILSQMSYSNEATK